MRIGEGRCGRLDRAWRDEETQEARKLRAPCSFAMGDRRVVGFLGRCGMIRGIALQQDVAAQAMQKRASLQCSPLAGRQRQRLVNVSQRPFRAKGLCLELARSAG